VKPTDLAKYLSDEKKLKTQNNEKKVKEIEIFAKFILDN